jgi:hypothetical protein
MTSGQVGLSSWGLAGKLADRSCPQSVGAWASVTVSTCQLVQNSPCAGVCKLDDAGQPLSIIAMISDSCPECEADHIDVQALAFQKVRALGTLVDG